MKLYTEFDINTFDAWSGAKETKETIINAGKADAFNSFVDDIFPDGTSETDINDFLWFDNSYIYEQLGIKDEDEDEEETDPEENESFQEFCSKYPNCIGCPYDDLK